MNKRKTLETFIPVLLPAGLVILGLIVLVDSIEALFCLTSIAALVVVGATQSVK